jgi:DNA-binding PadR family transcriptional regulator
VSQDLSNTFGAPAAFALRGLLPPRRAASGQQRTARSVDRGRAAGSVSDPVDELDSDDVVVDQDADGDLDEDEDQDEDKDQEEFEDEEDDLGEDATGDDVDDDLGDDDEREFDDGPAGEDDLVGDTQGRAVGRAEGRDPGDRDDRPRRPTAVRRPVASPAAAPPSAPRAAPADRRTPAPRAEPRRHSGTPGRPTRTAAGQWRVTRIATRGHIDLLVLLALRQGPGDGRDVIARLHAGSDGALQLPDQTVYRTLHRLTRNRLVLRRRDPVVRRARYVLSETGERVWRSRLGQWQAFVRTVDAVAQVGGQN